MVSTITTIIYVILSAIVIAAMKSETNKRLKKNKNEEIEILNVKLYSKSKRLYIAFLVLIVISALCGFVVSNNAISIIASIEIGVCYLATLSAAIIDLKTKIIPNYIPFSVVGIRLCLFIFEMLFVDNATSYMVSSLIGCFLCGIILVLANKISKGGIGAGDIKLLSSIGLMCGLYVTFSTLLIALLCCVLISMVLVILKKKTAKDDIPFGPCIYLGFTIMCLFTLY